MKSHLKSEGAITYNQVVEKIEALTQLKDAMERAGVAEPGAMGERPRRKAPNGVLEDAILQVLAGSKGATHPEIRELLQKAEYPYSLHPENLRQTLVRMRKQRKLRGEGEGRELRYSPGK